MVAYNFAARFAPAVESGEKRQTIRRTGKRNPPRPGDKLQLYTGMRTKSCRLLKLATCTNVTPIQIRPDVGEVLIQKGYEGPWLIYDSDKAMDILAALDGFHSKEEFFRFFEEQSGHDKQFFGVLIEWVPEEIT